MEYILVSQLKLILLRLSNSDDEILTVVIISLLLLLYLSKFFIAYFFTKHYFVNYVLFLFLLFLYFTEHFLNQQGHGLHSKNLYTMVLLRSSCLTDICQLIDNLLRYARIGVFQSVKFKSFNKVYTDRSVKLGNPELLAVFLLICALLLMYASVIFNKIVNNFEKFKFLVFLNVANMLFMLSSISIFNFYFSCFYIQILNDKQIKKLLLKLLLICCEMGC